MFIEHSQQTPRLYWQETPWFGMWRKVRSAWLMVKAYNPWHWKAHAKIGTMPAMGVTGIPMDFGCALEKPQKGAIVFFADSIIF
jgi:hypothetical protein